jgi:hypothetical protein
MLQDETARQPNCEYRYELNSPQKQSGCKPKGGYLKKHHLNLNLTTVLCLLAISLAAIFVAGCSSNAVAPSTDNSSLSQLDWLNSNLAPGQADRAPALVDLPVVFDTTLTQAVDSKGSTFTVVNGKEKIEFKVPGKALASPVLLTIHVTKYQAPFGSFWLLDCGPNGTVFAKPLEVKLNGEIQKNSGSVLYYFNPVTGVWEVQEILNAKSMKGFSIYHFSKYGISS